MLPLLTFEGTVVAPPELRFTPSGAPVTTFRVVANERKRNDDGSWTDGDATFLSVVCWRRLAENVAESVNRGNKVVVTGRLKQRDFQDREGKNRTVYELAASNVAVSLLFDQARVQKTERQQGQQQGDPWAAQPKQVQNPDPWAQPQPDEPPF